MLILSGSQIRTLSVACCEQTSEESRGGSGFSVRVVVFHGFDSNQVFFLNMTNIQFLIFKFPVVQNQHLNLDRGEKVNSPLIHLHDRKF